MRWASWATRRGQPSAQAGRGLLETGNATEKVLNVGSMMPLALCLDQAHHDAMDVEEQEERATSVFDLQVGWSHV